MNILDFNKPFLSTLPTEEQFELSIMPACELAEGRDHRNIMEGLNVSEEDAMKLRARCLAELSVRETKT